MLSGRTKTQHLLIAAPGLGNYVEALFNRGSSEFNVRDIPLPVRLLCMNIRYVEISQCMVVLC